MNNILIFITLSLFFLPVGIGISRLLEQKAYKNRQTGVFLFAYFLYGFYMLGIHAVLFQDPRYDFFNDQIFYYESAIDLSQNSIADIFQILQEEFRYSEAPLIHFLNSVYLLLLRNISGIFDYSGVTLCTPIVFFAALIPVFMGKTLRSLDLYNRNSVVHALLIFILCSPLFYHTAFLYRDIHIFLLYTILFHCILVPRLAGRYLWFALLLGALYFLRKENALFAITFLFVFFYDRSIQKSTVLKYTLLAFGILLTILVAIILFDTLYATLSSYNARSLSAADSASFGQAVATRIPIPFNYLLLSAFSQILPFPFYLEFTRNEVHCFLYAITFVSPFYWLYIIFAITRYWKSPAPALLRNLFYCALLYIFLTSIAEFNVRRQMVVTPLFFYLYIALTQNVKRFNKSMIFAVSTVCLWLLHFIYWGLLWWKK